MMQPRRARAGVPERHDLSRHTDLFGKLILRNTVGIQPLSKYRGHASNGDMKINVDATENLGIVKTSRRRRGGATRERDERKMEQASIVSDIVDSYVALRIGSGPRLRVRRVDEREAMRSCVVAALAKPGHVAAAAHHGGSVVNSYGWPAETEAVVALAVVVDGWLWIAMDSGRLPANKVTRYGVASMSPVTAPYADLWHGWAVRRGRAIRSRGLDLASAMAYAAEMGYAIAIRIDNADGAAS